MSSWKQELVKKGFRWCPTNQKQPHKASARGKAAKESEKCGECGKPVKVKAEPSRHLCSPSRAGFKLGFCSAEHRDQYQIRTYAHLAKLDCNASDSECFEHLHWEGKYRVGRCKVTGEVVRVEPLQPGEKSGQPKACYDHFVLKERYRKLIGMN